MDKFGYWLETQHLFSNSFKSGGLSLNDMFEKNNANFILLSDLFEKLGGIDNILTLIFKHQMDFFNKKQWNDCYNLLLHAQYIENQSQCYEKNPNNFLLDLPNDCLNIMANYLNMRGRINLHKSNSRFNIICRQISGIQNMFANNRFTCWDMGDQTLLSFVRNAMISQKLQLRFTDRSKTSIERGTKNLIQKLHSNNENNLKSLKMLFTRNVTFSNTHWIAAAIPFENILTLDLQWSRHNESLTDFYQHFSNIETLAIKNVKMCFKAICGFKNLKHLRMVGCKFIQPKTQDQSHELLNEMSETSNKLHSFYFYETDKDANNYPIDILTLLKHNSKSLRNITIDTQCSVRCSRLNDALLINELFPNVTKLIIRSEIIEWFNFYNFQFPKLTHFRGDLTQLHEISWKTFANMDELVLTKAILSSQAEHYFYKINNNRCKDYPLKWKFQIKNVNECDRFCEFLNKQNKNNANITKKIFLMAFLYGNIELFEKWKPLTRIINETDTEVQIQI